MRRRRYHHKKPRKYYRLRRRHARWLNSLTPGERELYEWMVKELRDGLRAEEDRQILWGEGQPL